jgi:hypothetical protein
MTNPDNSPPDDTWLSEQEAQRLLARAAELEVAESDGISLRTLRGAALEAGISSTAFDRAANELVADVPGTVGATLASRLGRSRDVAFLITLSGASLISPGDALTVTLMLTGILYGTYESVIVAARFFGRGTGGGMGPTPGENAARHRQVGGGVDDENRPLPFTAVDGTTLSSA